MVHDPDLLDALEQLGAEAWSGRVFRHVLNDNAPELANTRGARWNPPGTAALYTSLAAQTAEAEGSYLISQQSPPLRISRTVYELEVAVTELVDLRGPAELLKVGISEDELGEFRGIPARPSGRLQLGSVVMVFLFPPYATREGRIW